MVSCAHEYIFIGGEHMQRRKKRGKRSKRMIWASVSALVILLMYLLHISFQPVIRTVSENQAHILATSIMNKAVLAELADMQVEYDSLVDLVYDAAGNIAAISTRTLELNRVKAQLTEAVADALTQLPLQDVRIPLGTLTGIELLSGRGPDIKLKMMPSSYVESEFTSRFDSAGINQTRHQIVIVFTVNISAILAPYTTKLTVTSSMVVAETVIVGNVPQFYFDGSQTAK